MQPAETHDLQRFIGRSEARREVLSVEPLRRFAAAVGADLNVERTFPPLGHWAYFLDTPDSRELGADGHRRPGGGLIPPLPLTRRMFGGSHVTFHNPLTLGAPADLVATLVSVKAKHGSSGALIVVDLLKRISQDGVVRLEEQQAIVYREADAPPSPLPQPDATREAAHASWIPSRVELFRFSAATYNAHRIHYDAPYARDAEGYPDLVVQGPLVAARLCALATVSCQSDLRTFSFRAKAPMFVEQEICLLAGPEPGAVRALRCDGVVAMSAAVRS